MIERSVIVSETDALTVDEGRFVSKPATAQPMTGPLAEQLTIRDRTTSESTPAATRGRVSGPTGAARQAADSIVHVGITD